MYPPGYYFPIDGLFWGAVIFLVLFLVCFSVWKVMSSRIPEDDTKETRASVPREDESFRGDNTNTTKDDTPPKTIAGLLPENWQTAYRTDRRRRHNPPR